MQHLDEGTIHAWLDGQLSPDESAKAESHVRDCSECRERVAEARGLIAASTRILTALDDVPSGVLPAPASASPVSTRKRRWYDRTDLRTAAALLFVAGASLVAVRLMQNPGEALRTSAAVKQPAARTSQAEAAPVVAAPVVTARVITPAEKKVAVSPPKSLGSAERGVRSDQAAVSPSEVGGIPMPVNPIAPQVPNKSVDAVLGGRAAGVADRAASESVSRRDVTLNEVVMSGVAASGKLSDASIRQLSVDSTGNTRRTVYEVAPGLHVTLAESPLPAPGVVADEMQKANQAPPRAAMRVAASAAASAAPVMNTIRWTEGSRSYTLTGPLSIADLETLKARIMKLHR